MNDLTRVTTGEVRFSYCHLFKPYAAMVGQEEKYSVTVLVPKTDVETMNRINTAIEAAKQRGISEKWNGQCPPIVPTPVHDGDGVRPSDGMEFGPECKGHWVFTASAKVDYPPEVVDLTGNPILNQSEVYSCGLGPVRKTRDGEALGGGAITAAQAFGLTSQSQAAALDPVTQPQPATRGWINPITGMPM